MCGERECGGAGMDLGREDVSAGVGMCVGALVMGMGGVIMCVIVVVTGGMDATVYAVVVVAPEVSRSALLQIGLR